MCPNCQTCQVCVTCQGQEQVSGTGCGTCFTCQQGVHGMLAVQPGMGAPMPRPMMPPPSPMQKMPQPVLMGECLNCNEKLDQLLKTLRDLVDLLSKDLKA